MFKIRGLYPKFVRKSRKTMNLHEYQGKEILAGYGVRIQRGKVAQTPAEAVEVAKQLTDETGTSWYVVKAQVHAGGRGNQMR